MSDIVFCYKPKLIMLFAIYLQVTDTRSSTSYFPPVVPAMPPRIPIRLQHLCHKRRQVHNQLQKDSEDVLQAQEVGVPLLTREGSFHLPAIPPPAAVLRPFTNAEVKDIAQLVPLV